MSIHLGEKVRKNGLTFQAERGEGCERRERREGAHGPHAVTCWLCGSARGILGAPVAVPTCATEGAQCAAPSRGGEFAGGGSRSVHRCVQSEGTEDIKLWWASGLSPGKAINSLKAGMFSV